jgi:hypothetical protein
MGVGFVDNCLQKLDFILFSIPHRDLDLFSDTEKKQIQNKINSCESGRSILFT